MHVPRTLILSLIVALSPAGAAVCAIVCGTPSAAVAETTAAVTRSAHAHHAAHLASPGQANPASGPAVAAGVVSCQPVPRDAARMRSSSVDLIRFCHAVDGALAGAVSTPIGFRRFIPPDFGPPPLRLHQSPVPLRI